MYTRIKLVSVSILVALFMAVSMPAFSASAEGFQTEELNPLAPAYYLRLNDPSKFTRERWAIWHELAVRALAQLDIHLEGCVIDCASHLGYRYAFDNGQPLGLTPSFFRSVVIQYTQWVCDRTNSTEPFKTLKGILMAINGSPTGSSPNDRAFLSRIAVVLLLAKKLDFKSVEVEY